jgi:hypothetical protein
MKLPAWQRRGCLILKARIVLRDALVFVYLGQDVRPNRTFYGIQPIIAGVNRIERTDTTPLIEGRARV